MLKDLQYIRELIKKFFKDHFGSNGCPCDDCYKDEIEALIAEQIDPILSGRTLLVVNGKVSFRVANTTNDIGKKLQSAIMNNIFSERQKVFPTDKIFFNRVKNPESAQVKIFFTHNGDIATPPPIPFKTSSLAYAFPPYNGPYSGHIYVNDEHDFGLNYEQAMYNLRKVMTHECGHVLNLGHSDNPEDIMFRKYQRNKDINITQETKNLLLSMYSKYL